MYSRGGIQFVQIDGDHLRFSNDDLEKIFIPFLKGEQELSHKSSRTITETPEISVEAWWHRII